MTIGHLGLGGSLALLKRQAISLSPEPLMTQFAYISRLVSMFLKSSVDGKRQSYIYVCILFAIKRLIQYNNAVLPVKGIPIVEIRQSYLHNGIFYTSKMTTLY